MAFTRASLTYLGVVGAFTLGLAIGPLIDAGRDSTVSAAEAPPAMAAVAPSVPPAPAPAPPRASAPRLERVPTASAEPVQRKVRSLLNRGADVRKASEGFSNAYQFMTVAHAARNTEIPFVVLKHRVLTERKPLGAAIRELKPELDGELEVNRARAEARADLARITGA